MMQARQGLHAFLRAYYHMKSADWRPNKPFRLTSGSASEFAKLPTYYGMELDRNMPETVAWNAWTSGRPHSRCSVDVHRGEK